MIIAFNFAHITLKNSTVNPFRHGDFSDWKEKRTDLSSYSVGYCMRLWAICSFQLWYNIWESA